VKIFLSWSGARSRAVADALNDWLPRVIQAVRPFFSPEIEKGANWSNQIDAALEGTSFGVVCLTQDNLHSQWIHYEAGALSKTPDALIWTFLLDVEKGDVKPPLGRFQHTAAEEDDVRDLLRTINRRLADGGGTPLRDAVLDETFDDLWPRLEKRLDAARQIAHNDSAPSSTRRDIHEMVEEALELLRQQQRDAAPAASPQSTSLEHGAPASVLLRRQAQKFSLSPVSQPFISRFLRGLEVGELLLGFEQSPNANGTFRLLVWLKPPVDIPLLEHFASMTAASVAERSPVILHGIALVMQEEDR
jgi:hypothetical protein